MKFIEFNHKLTDLHQSLQFFARSLTSSIEDANDLTQETMLKALNNRDKFDPTTNMKAWTFTIMKNTFINNYRKNQRSGAFVDTTADLYYLNLNHRTKDDDPDVSFSTSEIRKVVDNLDNEHKIPFMMHFDGYKYKEIAEELDLSLGTVKSRIFFSRQKMMSQLMDYAS